MPIITYIEHGGTQHRVTVDEGMSLMEGAITNGVPGIDGDCGGACACATCHIYIDPAWIGRLETRSETETDMLELAEGVTEASRLACQIKAANHLDGLTVRLPESQH